MIIVVPTIHMIMEAQVVAQVVQVQMIHVVLTQADHVTKMTHIM